VAAGGVTGEQGVPPLPSIRSRPQNPVRGVVSAVSSPSRVWGGAPADKLFGAF